MPEFYLIPWILNLPLYLPARINISARIYFVCLWLNNLCCSTINCSRRSLLSSEIYTPL